MKKHVYARRNLVEKTLIVRMSLNVIGMVNVRIVGNPALGKK
jgi:hypothetical protein